MTFIETVAEEDATEPLAAVYASDRATFGHIPNFTRAFSLRPEVYAAWRGLNGAVKAGMDPRRYELVTIAAARHLRSSYCMLAHGKVLADGLMDADQVRALAIDHRDAGLDAVDVAIMDLAEKVAEDATSVTQADVDGLRGLGPERHGDPRRRARRLGALLLLERPRRPRRPARRALHGDRARAARDAHRGAADRAGLASSNARSCGGR